MVEQFMLTVDGVPYAVEIRGNQISVNGYVMTLGSQEDNVFQVEGTAHIVELTAEGQAVVDGFGYSINVEWPTDERESARKASRVADTVASKGTITAIMPGRVVRVLVQPGESVKQGQVLAILEAMKMENELTAPADGVVKQVLISAGANVEQGQALVEVE